MRISELEQNGQECLTLLPEFSINKKTHPCPNPDCNSSDAFNVSIKNGSLLGYCFSCQTGYNFRTLYKEINNLNHDEYIERLLSLGYQTDFTALIDPVEIFKTMKKKHVKDPELIKYISETRKLDQRTIEKYCIVNDKVYFNTMQPDQLGYILGELGGPTVADKTPHEKVKIISMNDFILIPKVSYEGIYGGFIVCSPKAEKNYRYRNWYNENVCFLFEDTLTKNCDKIYITEGIFSALTVLDRGIPVLSITGGSHLDYPERLLKILSNFKNIKTVVFAFDTDDAGIQKTKSFLDKIYSDLNKMCVKTEIFMTKIDDSFNSFDDIINSGQSFNRIDWISYNAIVGHRSKTKVITSLLRFPRSTVFRNHQNLIKNLKLFLNVGDEFIESTMKEYNDSTFVLTDYQKMLFYKIFDESSELEVNTCGDIDHIMENLNRQVLEIKDNLKK